MPPKSNQPLLPMVQFKQAVFDGNASEIAFSRPFVRKDGPVLKDPPGRSFSKWKGVLVGLVP